MKMRILAAVLAILTLAPSLANTARAETFPVITDKTVIKECGECHMVFPPETLSKAAWENILAGMSKHFGEDASLKPEVVATIRDFHLANAADASSSRAASKWRVDGPQPMRIVDAPRFKKKHHGCEAAFTHEKVRSPANCLACHPAISSNGNVDAKINFIPPAVKGKCGAEDD